MDDPLDAVAVHGAGGIIGLLAVPWFMYTGGALTFNILNLRVGKQICILLEVYCIVSH